MTKVTPGNRKVTGAKTGLRLNVGCGPDAVQNWINIDRSPHILLDRLPVMKRILFRAGALADEHMTEWPQGILFHDVRKGLPFPDASAEAIYSSHMLEHLYFDEANQTLREFRRLLSSEGVLRLALPDTEQLAASFLKDIRDEGAGATLEFNKGLSAHPMSPPSGLRRLTGRLGASVHRWQPTRALVSQMLRDAGFGTVTDRGFLVGDLVDLQSVEHRAESFFLEARLPTVGSNR